MTIVQAIADYLASTPSRAATVSQIYSGVLASGARIASKTPDASIRARLYENSDRFERIARGVFMLAGEESASLIIEGDGRSLDMVEDRSIDCIITDHPWDCSKSNRGGNRSFADYSTFNYVQEDFDAKARVLKDGAYLVEFLPVESEANWRYLAEVKQMAYKAGFRLYASCIWRKARGGFNTGRTTKGVEQVVIFSKGAPRRLSRKGVPYMTRNMLDFEIDIPISRARKAHKAEKPVELYKYLIENLTDEREAVLDQFGGSCNAARACAETNRFGIVFETCADYVSAAAERFGAVRLAVLESGGREPKAPAAPNAGAQLCFSF